MLIALLLVIVFIGGPELLVCRFADPVLYAQIVDPVCHQASFVFTAVKHSAAAVWDKTLSAVSDAANLLKSDADSQEDQAAAEPDASLAPKESSDPTITALELRENQEVLTGGCREITYFNQADAAWCEQPYGKDHIGKYGCGPTSLAMVVSSLTGQLLSPSQMAQWAVSNGHWANHGGSALSIVNGAAENYGLTVESIPACDADRLQLELSSGKIAVALMTKGHFTNGGHFILLRGTTLDGKILVADPNSRERSLTAWDAQLILDELSKSRSSGAPLWFLSADKK